MKDTSKPNTIRLTEYLIEQGAGADPKARAAIFARIYSEALPAFITVHPASPPVGASIAAVLRHAMSAEAPREVSALSDAKAKAEIRRAALGHIEDWTLLDRLTVHVPDATPLPTRTRVKAVPREQAHKENILAAIEVLGYDPKKLPSQKSGSCGVKSEVRKHIGNSMPRSAFNKAWQSLRDEKLIDDS